jgi:hypothetical protein
MGMKRECPWFKKEFLKNFILRDISSAFAESLSVSKGRGRWKANRILQLTEEENVSGTEQQRRPIKFLKWYREGEHFPFN